MPQLDSLIFAPLLTSLLLFTALLVPFISELLLLATLGFRGRRLLESRSNHRSVGGSATRALGYGGADRSGYSVDATSLRSYRSALAKLLQPYDATSGQRVAHPAPASGLGLWRSIFRVLATSDHKLIGRMYLVFGFFAALVGSILSLVIRLQLTYPGSPLLGENYQLYNVVVTMHAFIMIFMFV